MRILLGLFIFVSLLGATEALYLNDTSKGVDKAVGLYLYYYEDSDKLESISSISKHSFTACSRDVPNFGISSSAYWFKLTVLPDEEALGEQWWLKIGYPLIDKLDLYLQNSSGDLVAHKSSGVDVPLQKREIEEREFFFKLPFSDTDEHTLYLRVETQGAMQVPLFIKNSKGIVESSTFDSILIGLYYGVFILIVLYNSLLYYYKRENIYLLFVLLVLLLLFRQLIYDGVGAIYFWSELKWIAKDGLPLLISVLSIVSIWLTQLFLQTKENSSKVNIALQGLKIVAVLVAVVDIFLEYHTAMYISSFLWLFAGYFNAASSVLLFSRGDHSAFGFAVGWSIIFFGSATLFLNKIALIDGYFFVRNSQQIGVTLAVVLFSWALAKRVNFIEQGHIKELSRLNSTLETEVKKGIDEARNKDKMLIQQSRLAALGEMIEQIAHQWRQPLNAISLISQEIFFKKELGKFKESDIDKAHQLIESNVMYMSNTIDDFRNYFNSGKDKEVFKVQDVIKSALSLQSMFFKRYHIHTISIYEGDYRVKCAKGEMVQVLMNLFSNAKDAIVERNIKHGEIEVIVRKVGVDVEITVEDNAGGIDKDIIDNVFDPYFTTKFNSQGTGIGLYMTKSIVVQSMKGRVWATNGASGACLVVRIPIYVD